MSVKHSVQVSRLYRRALRWCFDWHVSFENYRANCLAVRAEFERHRNVKDPQKIALLMDAGNYCLWKYQHSEPYKCN